MSLRPVARQGVDGTTVPLISGATTVFVNGKPVGYKGSITAAGETVVTGYTGKVFAENRPIARRGDLTSSGVPILSGSLNVFAGDQK